MMDVFILAVLSGLLFFFMFNFLRSVGDARGGGKAPRQSIPTSISVPQNSIVRIRHASDGVEVEVSPAAPFDGPLSDAAEDAALWERLQSGSITAEERRRIAVILRGHGFQIELDEDPHADTVMPETREETAEPAAATPPPEERQETAAEPVPGKLSRYDLKELQELIVRGLKERLCTPAFALLASQEYGFSLEFEDGQMRERAADESELALAEGYRDAIRRDLAEAMRLYSEDHPEPPAKEAMQPAPVLPEYDFGRLR